MKQPNFAVPVNFINQEIAQILSSAPDWTTQPIPTYVWTTITALLVYRSYSHSSLTVPGILAATATATVHALYPTPLPFILLCTFFLLGTSATKRKAEIKATLTLSSTGGSAIAKTHNTQTSPEPATLPKPQVHARNATQVLANSGCASLLCLLQLIFVKAQPSNFSCYGHSIYTPKSAQLPQLLLAGIVANYAAVTADTFSSELGILSPSRPRLITTLRSVPPGTNGGVSPTGILAGSAGALVIGVISVSALPICNRQPFWIVAQGYGADTDVGKITLALTIAIWGTFGSLIDSLLGAILQASVVDRRSGKVVEASDGGRVKVTPKHDVDGGTGKPGREIATGKDILSNNAVNYTMASIMSVGAMFVVGYMWKLDLATMRASVGLTHVENV